MPRLCVTLALAACGASRLSWAQQNRSRSFASGACGPADHSYIRVAEDTGGIPFFFQRSEVSKAMKFTAANFGENRVTLLWATGSLQSAVREFLVPVDSTLDQVVFTLSVDNHLTTMDVFRPLGVPITSADTRTDTTELNCGRFIVLKNPLPGLYRLRVNGSGTFWIEATGKSGVFLHSVRFVEPGGRPGHEGLFPISGQPVLGKPAVLEAHVSGPIKTAAFALVSNTDEQIKPLQMHTVHAGTDEREFVTNLELPISPFRIIVSGTDLNGYSYQRFFNPLFHPTTVVLVLIRGPEDVPAGTTAVFTYSVLNGGAAATFHVVAASSRSFATSVDPSDVTLSAAESAKLEVSVTVPSGIQPFTGSDLTVTVESRNDPAVFNGASHHFSVSPGSQ